MVKGARFFSPVWGAAVLAACLFAPAVPAASAAGEEARFGPIDLGGRFEYEMRYDDTRDPYAWNASTHSVTNRSRLMLDLDLPTARYGSLYLKGAASWEAVGADDVRKRFLFEQGDYFFARTTEALGLGVRVFANERRFSVYDWTTPLVSDDSRAANGENGGARIDADIRGRIGITALYSVLAGDFDDAPRIAYAKARYDAGRAVFSASYLSEDRGVYGAQNHAVFKAELAGAYRRLFAAVSYAQSGYDDSHVFFPGGSFDWGAYDGTNFSSILPPGGAALAEIRLASLRATKRGSIDLVWKYDALREEFSSDAGGAGAPGVGQTAGAYFTARNVSLNASALFHTRTRSSVEHEETDWFDAGVWAALKNGMECFARGGAGDIDGGPVPLVRESFVHAGLRHRAKRATAGVYAMVYDVGAETAGERYAWDGKLMLNPSWGLHWRFLFAKDLAASRSALVRIEYRPNDRVYATLGYGEPDIGDDPFALEDRDLGLMRGGASRYTISLRGDF
jgi:hypothetical protein